MQVRRVAKGREVGAEKEIRGAYQKLLKELQHFVADEYAKLAEDDRLTYAILQKHGEFANFLEVVQKHLDTLTPEMSKTIQTLVQDTYKITYDGMVSAVKSAVDSETLQTALRAVKASTPEIIKRAVDNPVSGLILKDTLEKNRRNIIYDIKQQIGIGLTNGDRYSTMANRIKTKLNEDYAKSIRIVRTEAHRVQEAGNLDAAIYVNGALLKGVMTKTWKTMADVRVRPNRQKRKTYDHVRMNGITVPVDEDFTLPSGAKTKAPGNSGVSGEDINCRCYLSYDLQEVAEKEYKRLTESQYDNLIEEHRKNVTEEEQINIVGFDWDNFKFVNEEHGYINTENSFKINQAIRDNEVSSLPKASQLTIKDLQNIIARSTINTDTIAVRNVDANWLINKFGSAENIESVVAEAIKSEKMICDNQFVSASLNENVSYTDRLIEVILEVPAGYHGYVTENRMESEIIFYKPSYRPKSIQTTGDHKIKITCEMEEGNAK